MKRDIGPGKFEFLVRIMQFCRQPDEISRAGRMLARQLLHSGAPIGTKVEEAQETHHWLRLLALAVLLLLHTVVLGAEPSSPSLLD